MLKRDGWNVHWFNTIKEAKMLIETWRRDYNESRPHMGIGNIPPREYALQECVSPSPTGLLEAESQHRFWTTIPERFSSRKY